jgi:hypothetical protein
LVEIENITYSCIRIYITETKKEDQSGIPTQGRC